MTACFICHHSESKLDKSSKRGDSDVITCKRCGTYRISGSAQAELISILEKNQNAISILSYAVRQMQKNTKIVELNSYIIKSILQETLLPSIKEQSENFVRYLGDTSLAKPGDWQCIIYDDDVSIFGCPDGSTVLYIIRSLKNADIIEMHPASGNAQCQLTFDGWTYYEELKQKASESKLAFMAMPFNNKELNEVYLQCFKPAVKATGFELRRLDETPEAGLIDNRLRVEIRKSRFLIAELKDSNEGAYWEAGFAEGLGRPVIYTCEQTFFADYKTHFDTNHCQTVVWAADKLEKAAEDLKATIRATLPAEAKLTDE